MAALDVTTGMLNFSGRSESRLESVVLLPICLPLGRSDPGILASPVLEASLSVVFSPVLVPMCLASSPVSANLAWVSVNPGNFASPVPEASFDQSPSVNRRALV